MNVEAKLILLVLFIAISAVQGARRGHYFYRPGFPSNNHGGYYQYVQQFKPIDVPLHTIQEYGSTGAEDYSPSNDARVRLVPCSFPSHPYFNIKSIANNGYIRKGDHLGPIVTTVAAKSRKSREEWHVVSTSSGGVKLGFGKHRRLGRGHKTLAYLGAFMDSYDNLFANLATYESETQSYSAYCHNNVYYLKVEKTNLWVGLNRFSELMYEHTETPSFGFEIET